MLSSHMTMKKAIIAVTKSAYATFQLPPWCAACPFFFLTMRMTLFSFPSDAGMMVVPSGRAAARQPFQLGEARPIGRLDVAARELNGGHRRVAAREREQRRAD